MDLANFERPFSNLAHFWTCGKVTFSNLRRLRAKRKERTREKLQWPDSHTLGQS